MNFDQQKPEKRNKMCPRYHREENQRSFVGIYIAVRLLVFDLKLLQWRVDSFDSSQSDQVSLPVFLLRVSCRHRGAATSRTCSKSFARYFSDMLKVYLRFLYSLFKLRGCELLRLKLPSHWCDTLSAEVRMTLLCKTFAHQLTSTFIMLG